jgi:multidrug efflux pump subunit AcrB
MNAFTDLFIRRPVLATVVSLLILLIGGVAGLKLQIRQFPQTSNTTITITTTYPGANADVIKGFVTTPIEQAVASTDGIDTLVSTSQQNVSTITLNLRLDANPDRAMSDALSKVNQARRVLPKDVNDPVIVKQTGQGTALMYLSFNSNVMSSSQITDYLIRVVQAQLQTVDGVANAQILGGQTFAMRIWLDPTRMAARGVTPNDVSRALAANNFISAAGEVKSDYTQISVDAQTSLDSAQAFGKLVIAAHGDGLVRLGDVATIDLGPQSSDASVTFDGQKAVVIGIYGTTEANPLTVIDGVRAVLPGVQARLPAGLSTAIAYDSTEFIRSSIREVAKTLFAAALIVIAIIFLFIGNIRSTIIPIVTIPLSLIGVMMALLALGYSINLLTLLALVLAIGLVVDDAIVVVENIHRHIEDGMTPFDASIRGAHEIALPVVAMTITLAAVYAPIGFVSGVTGALFREFAFTLAGSVIISGFLALTLSPMMCSKLLRHETGSAGRFGAFVDRTFDGLRRAYQRRLSSSLNFRALTLLVLVGVLAMTGVMYLSTPRELAPEEDQGFLIGVTKTPQLANRDYMEHATQRLHDEVKSVPEVEHAFMVNGYPNVRAGFAGMILKPWDQRTRSQKQVLAALGPKFLAVPEAQVQAFAPPSLPGSTGGAPMQFVIRTTDDYSTLADVAAKMQDAARASGLFLFTDVDLKFDTPEYVVGRRRQGQPHRRQHGRRRRRAVDHARRQLRQPVQPARAQLSGHSAGAARLPPVARMADALPVAHQQRRVRAAVGGGDRHREGAAQRADQLPAAQFGDAVGRAVPRPHARRGARLPQVEVGGGLPRRLFLRFPGRLASARAGGQRAHLCLRLRVDRHLSRAVGAIRELPRSVHHSGGAAHRAVRRAAAAQHRRRDGLRHHQHLFADRPGDADRPDRQARHPDGRFRQQSAGDAGPVAPRRDRRGGVDPPPSDPDDDRGDGRRHGAADHRHRRRRAVALRHRPDDLLRHGDRHDVHAVRHADGLHLPRPRPCGVVGARARRRPCRGGPRRAARRVAAGGDRPDRARGRRAARRLRRNPRFDPPRRPGGGAQSRFTIGLTILFGMAIGTLFVTPMAYTFLARDHATWMAKQRAAGRLVAAHDAPPEGSHA